MANPNRSLENRKTARQEPKVQERLETMKAGGYTDLNLSFARQVKQNETKERILTKELFK